MKKMFVFATATLLMVGCWKDSGCPNCSCEAGCCDSGVCATVLPHGRVFDTVRGGVVVVII